MFLMQKYEERLELARKSERKWQRTLKFKRLCELSWIKNNPKFNILLKNFGDSIIICIFAALVPAEPLNNA